MPQGDDNQLGAAYGAADLPPMLPEMGTAVSDFVRSTPQAVLDQLAALNPTTVNPLTVGPRAAALGPGQLEAAMPLALGFAGGGMTRPAWHGTPHTFEPEPNAPFGAFKNEAIGSGEGAQAYGWGHYVAGNPKVAEGYKESLAGSHLVPADASGNPLGYNQIVQQYYEPGNIIPGFGGYDKVLALRSPGKTNWSVDVIGVRPTDVAQEMIANHELSWPDLMNRGDLWEAPNSINGVLNRPRNHSTYPGDTDIQNMAEQRGWQMTTPGHLLEVHVLPEEHELLDWDRPLSAQPPDIQEKLQSLAEQVGPHLERSIANNETGENLYRSIGRSDPVTLSSGQMIFPRGGGDKTASAMLHEAGIPGIRYLDAGSRNLPDPAYVKQQIDYWTGIKAKYQPDYERNLADFGPESSWTTSPKYHIDEADRNIAEWQTKLNPTHNYVIFDPSNLRIVGRNGQRLEPVDHNPFAGESE